MHVKFYERSLFKAYIAAVTVLFALYIIPVILFSFLGIEVTGIPADLQDLAEHIYRYFFLIGVPLLSVLLGALSMGVLGWRSVPDDPKELPRYIGYLMFFVTLLSIFIWIIDMSVY